MARENYGEDEIITLTFEEGDSFDVGIMGTFEVDGKEYIALEALDGTDDVYLYGYVEDGDDFMLEDIEDEETFNKVAEEFDSLMDEPL